MIKWLEEIAIFIWGQFLFIPLLLGTGIYLTIRLGGLQFLKLIPALRLAFIDRSEKDADGDITHYGALATALAATVGVGNIAGVATAIHIGGPGAVLWIWVTDLFGMASKYREVFMGVRFRTVDAKGEISGGPQWYLKRAIPGGIGVVLSIAFAVFAILASFGIGNMTQSDTVAAVVQDQFGVTPWILGAVLMVFTGLVLIGGIKSIARLTSAVVPAMIVLYVLAALVVLALNIGAVPDAFGLISTDAFTGTAATGGFTGAILAKAIQFGVARGIFSNESGLGSAAIAAAAATTRHPVRQGLGSMTHTFIDTIIVVTMTALVIVSTGAWTSENKGATLTSEAFSVGLPGEWGSIIVTLAVIFFGGSTVLGWAYYGERCAHRLFGIRSVIVYRVVFTLVVFLGATTELATVWTLSDIMTGLMALPNLIGLLICSSLIARETQGLHPARPGSAESAARQHARRHRRMGVPWTGGARWSFSVKRSYGRSILRPTPTR